MLSFGTLPDATQTPLAFGGASGSGKTLVLAKLAARYILAEEHKDRPPPLIIACDHTAGSFAKLSALLQPYNIPIIQGNSPEILADAVLHKEPGQPILVDLPGICVYSPVSMGRMMQMVERVGATLSLVLPAGLDAEESADIGYAFAQQGATTMVASKMDQAGRVGGIIAAAACGLTLTYGSCSSSIVGGWCPLTRPFWQTACSPCPPEHRRQNHRAQAAAYCVASPLRLPCLCNSDPLCRQNRSQPQQVFLHTRSPSPLRRHNSCMGGGTFLEKS